MPQAAVVNMHNERTGEVELPDAIFGREIKTDLIRDSVLANLANLRVGTASTKNRSAVSGGGRKPWRQKGTGRARAGSTRSPLWRGGGTIFGPAPRDYHRRLPQKARRCAFRSALSEKVGSGALVIMDSVAFQKPSTKAFLQMLQALGTKGKVLLAMPSPPATVVKSARSLPGVTVTGVEGLSTFQVCRHDTLILTRDALAFLEENSKR